MGFIVDYIKKEVNCYNKNVMIAIVGGCGSGKSYSALTLGDEADDNFGIDRVIFNAEGFLDLINANLPAGSVVIWDEAGVGIPTREWYTLSNKLISYVTQTFRHKNLVVIFTVPSFDFLDKHLRQLFDLCLETAGINKSERIVYMKPLFLQNNPRVGKVYNKYRFTHYNKMRSKVNRVTIPMPSLHLRRMYEIKKTEFTDKLNKSAKTTLKEVDPDFKKNQLTPRQNQIYQMLQKQGAMEVSKELGITPTSVYKARQVIVGKGFVC